MYALVYYLVFFPLLLCVHGTTRLVEIKNESCDELYWLYCSDEHLMFTWHEPYDKIRNHRKKTTKGLMVKFTPIEFYLTYLTMNTFTITILILLQLLIIMMLMIIMIIIMIIILMTRVMMTMVVVVVVVVMMMMVMMMMTTTATTMMMIMMMAVMTNGGGDYEMMKIVATICTTRITMVMVMILL